MNEGIPRFDPIPNNLTISELTPVGTVLVMLSGVDDDKANSSHSLLKFNLEHVVDCKLIYLLEVKHILLFFKANGQDSKSYFGVDWRSGKLALLRALDRDSGIIYYELNVSVTDGGGAVSFSIFRINLFNENEHNPEFSEKIYIIYINETEPVDTPIIDLTATDTDATQTNWTFLILKGNEDGFFKTTHFNNVATLKINRTLTPDITKIDKYSLQLAVYDNAPEASNTRSSTTLIIVIIKGVNNNQPSFAFNPWIHVRKIES